MNPLSVKAEATLRDIDAYGFASPYQFHVCTLRALFNRNLIVATCSNRGCGRNGLWIRLRRDRSEPSNAHLVISRSSLTKGAKR